MMNSRLRLFRKGTKFHLYSKTNKSNYKRKPLSQRESIDEKQMNKAKKRLSKVFGTFGATQTYQSMTRHRTLFSTK